MKTESDKNDIPNSLEIIQNCKEIIKFFFKKKSILKFIFLLLVFIEYLITHCEIDVQTFLDVNLILCVQINIYDWIS